MNLTLKVWRQWNTADKGRFVTYRATNISEHMSFLEMLDVLNEELIARGEEPIAFDSDCREGICGTYGFMIDGIAHGLNRATTVCQLHMRFFKDGEVLVLEPWRAAAFPVLKDLLVDRSAFDRIIQSNGYIAAPTGGTLGTNAIPAGKDKADRAMDAAADAGCGACVAARPHASVTLFTEAKVRTSTICPRDNRNATRGYWWLPTTMRRGLAIAPTMASARPCGPSDPDHLHLVAERRVPEGRAARLRFHRTSLSAYLWVPTAVVEASGC